ncbi:MAG: methyltransferase domain-containing protein [Chloroflexi bacterium]|nr:methyltransferase domain-containing protein [Chloroflexota bacterium]
MNGNKTSGDNSQGIKRQVQENFGRQALSYNANCLLADEENLNAIIRMAGIMGSERVLDLATGTGFLAAALSKVAKDVVATDITLEMLQQTRPKTGDNTSFALADVEILPFEDDSFDVVTCRVALHHFTKPDEAFREIRRVCRPEGRIVIMDIVSSEDGARSEYHNKMERLRDSSHVKQYSRSELEGMLKTCDLEMDEVNTWKYTWQMEEWLYIANPDEVAANKVRQLMMESIEDDKSGLRVQLRDEEVYFTYTAAIITAHVRT